MLGNTANAFSIGFALLIVLLAVAIQEYCNKAALKKHVNLVPLTCTILRDGQVLNNFPAWELVVGDLVLLSMGDHVPANCCVVNSVKLAIDESLLMGENHLVHKTREKVLQLGHCQP